MNTNLFTCITFKEKVYAKKSPPPLSTNFSEPLDEKCMGFFGLDIVQLACFGII